jgi:HK97 family phage major capsid protein
MPGTVSIKALREDRAKLAKQVTDLAGRAQSESREFTAEEQADWDRLNGEYDALTAAIAGEEKRAGISDRLAAINADMGRPAHDVGRLAGAFPTSRQETAAPLDREEAAALAIQSWFRCNASRKFPLSEKHVAACEASGLDPRAEELVIRLLPDNRMSALQAAYLNGPRAEGPRRAVAALNYGAALSSNTGSAGGTVMPPDSMVSSLEVNMLAYGGILQAAEIMRTTGRERVRWPTVNDTSNKGRRIGESKAVTTVDPTFGAVYWDVHKYTSDEILVPYELLDGSPFQLPTVLGQLMGERIGRKLADDFTTGTGNNQPKGIVKAAGTKAAASATAIAWDDLEALISAVDPAYRTGAMFMFHDATRAALKNLKDGMGRPLWQDGPNGAEPALLKGYPWLDQPEHGQHDRQRQEDRPVRPAQPVQGPAGQHHPHLPAHRKVPRERPGRVPGVPRGGRQPARRRHQPGQGADPLTRGGGTVRKIRLLTSRVLAGGQTQEFGDVIEVGRAEAERLIALGQAEPVRPAEKGPSQPGRTAAVQRS